jgi:hypothetical protein
LTVQKVWATYMKTDPKYVIRRVKLNAQLGELVHSVTVEYALEHEVICGSKPAGQKHREGETAAEQ